MLYNQDIYNDLIGYLGIEPGNGLPDTDARVLQAMNAALQEIYTKGPYYLRDGQGAAFFPNPTVVAFNVTQGSVAISNIVGWTPNMRGCVVRIDGEQSDNEFVDQNTLLVPITQDASEVTGTVYFNSYIPPANVVAISGNVFLDDTAWELQPYPYGENQAFKQWPAFPVDPYYVLQSSLYIRLRVGVPTGYYIVPAQSQVAPNWSFCLKLWPMPSNQHTVKWRQETCAPALTLASLEIGNPMPTPTLITPLQAGLHETAWLPLARKHLSAYPHFLESKRAYIMQEATEALDYLKSLTPQRQSGSQLRPRTFLPN